MFQCFSVVKKVRDMLPGDEAALPIPANEKSGSGSKEKEENLSSYEKFVISNTKIVNPNPMSKSNIYNSELNLYLQKPLIAIGLNPLTYWNVNQDNFPSLYKVSKIK